MAKLRDSIKPIEGKQVKVEDQISMATKVVEKLANSNIANYKMYKDFVNYIEKLKEENIMVAQYLR